jgi:hypothetical protein
MSGARLLAFLTGCLLVVVPAIAGVYNGATVLGALLMIATSAAQIRSRRD